MFSAERRDLNVGNSLAFSADEVMKDHNGLQKMLAGPE